MHVAALAFEYRQRFKRDVVIDLVGYRRWGHNEGDEPSYTQPLMYAKIKSHPSVAQLYGEHARAHGRRSRARSWTRSGRRRRPQMQREGESGPAGRDRRAARPVAPPPVDASAMWGRLRADAQGPGLGARGLRAPPQAGCRSCKKRAELLEGKGEVDWATAEALAFGTLLLEGIPVRLSGQDSGRGTFSQRHAVLYDVRTRHASTCPSTRWRPAGARFEVHDSLLSEAAVMGFEFGYAVAEHRALVMWEAQFGDFFNGAQVIIDQFLAGSRAEVGPAARASCCCCRTATRARGPEHSQRAHRALPDPVRRGQHARGLSLDARRRTSTCCAARARDPRGEAAGGVHAQEPAAPSALRVARCRSWRRAASSRCSTTPAPSPRRVRRVVLIARQALLRPAEGARGRRRPDDVALVRLEQLYPFPAAELAARPRPLPATAELVWAQEEPRNMGAWRFVRERFLDGDVPRRRRAPLALRRPRGERQPGRPARTRCTCRSRRRSSRRRWAPRPRRRLAVRQAAPATSIRQGGHSRTIRDGRSRTPPATPLATRRCCAAPPRSAVGCPCARQGLARRRSCRPAGRLGARVLRGSARLARPAQGVLDRGAHLVRRTAPGVAAEAVVRRHEEAHHPARGQLDRADQPLLFVRRGRRARPECTARSPDCLHHPRGS